MKRAGDFWVPDGDMRWGRVRQQTLKSFGEGRRGSQIHHLEGALAHLRDVAADAEAVDAGANVGAFTRTLAERFRRVHAFELAGETTACLARNIAEWGLGDRVSVHPCAVSDKRERVGVTHDPRKRRSISLRAVPAEEMAGGTGIAALPLDDLALNGPLAFLKLDVEGYEEKALIGAERLVERHRPVVMMEVKPDLNADYGEAWGAHDWLVARGYRVVDKLGKAHIDWVYAHETTHGDVDDLGRERLPGA